MDILVAVLMLIVVAVFIGIAMHASRRPKDGGGRTAQGK
jgi:hypothetical protein